MVKNALTKAILNFLLLLHILMLLLAQSQERLSNMEVARTQVGRRSACAACLERKRRAAHVCVFKMYNALAKNKPAYTYLLKTYCIET